MRRARRRRRTFLLVLTALLVVGAVLRPLPTELLAPSGGTEIVDRNGVRLAYRGAPERAPGQPLELHAFGDELVRATLAAEDHRFYGHPGIDPIGSARAAWHNARASRVVEGGSTITQQLARNLVPRGPGLRGKVGEAVLALRLEAWLPKDRILAEYLSRVYYGNAAIGADAAARLYFDRPPRALSLAQAATLAAIPRRPADLDPLRFPLRVRAARDGVLRRLAARGLADDARVEEALAEPLTLRSPAPVGEAPHLVRRVFTPVPRIRTTLDLRLQHAAEDAVRDVLADIAPHRAHHAAVIVVHNPTREVLAYVGSGDWQAADGQVDGVLAPRSPGSALKPFLYGLAVEEGATLADLVDDSPGTWTTTHGSWHPENYDEGSAGPVTLRSALARSLNVPAVRLAEQVGVADLHRRLVGLGLTTLDERPAHYGLSLALGGAEVRLDELAAAYATFASAGRWRPLRYTLDAPRTPPVRVQSPAAAFLVADALDDPDARAPAFGRDSVLEPAFPMAAKTGTSTGWRDNWAIGVTPAVTVAVWVGNFDGSPMTDISGVTGAGPILARVMATAMEGRPVESFEAPATLARRAICPLSGLARGPACPATRDEWLSTTVTRPSCDWHGADGLRVPASLSAWAGRAGLPVRAGPGTVSVTAPQNGATFWLDPARAPDDQAIPLIATAPPGGVAVWAVDGVEVATGPAPYTARWVPAAGDHQLTVTVDGVRSAPVRIWVGGGP
ncbi:MAG: penicillin-binding protein 1C [Pseudomonadota bacterium]|nr:penicillin-binding protein 1C [Pseudomonadota bacterium]